MDLTPAFLDHWREHRQLDYMDKVAAIFDQAAFDEDWLEGAQAHAFAREASATLGHAGIGVDAETVKAVVDRDEGDSLGDAQTAAAVRAYATAHRAALAAAEAEAPVTPALLDDLHAQLGGGAGAVAQATASLEPLCAWLAAPPDSLHPVVVAAAAQVELLRLRRWSDGNARVARLATLMLLARSGYGYRGLLAPSAHWSDPRRLPPSAVEGLQPHQAETQPAVEHVVHCVAQALRETVNRVRAEESLGSFAAMAFGWPVQP